MTTTHTLLVHTYAAHTRTGLPTNPNWKGGERARESDSQPASAMRCTFEPNYINKRAAPRRRLFHHKPMLGDRGGAYEDVPVQGQRL